MGWLHIGWLCCYSAGKSHRLPCDTATCSARNFDLLRSAGADEVFDYGDADVVDNIRKATNNNLRYAFDTVGAVSLYDSVLQGAMREADCRTRKSRGGVWRPRLATKKTQHPRPPPTKYIGVPTTKSEPTTFTTFLPPPDDRPAVCQDAG